MDSYSDLLQSEIQDIYERIAESDFCLSCDNDDDDDQSTINDDSTIDGIIV